MDYLHIIDWRKAEKLVAEGKAITINGAKVLPLELAAKERVLVLVGEPKSPHGADVTPDGKAIIVGDTAEEVKHGKPDPEGYNKALATLNAIGNSHVQPNESLVIEDSVAGVEAAKRAGMWCLAVTNSYKAEALAKADWIVSSLVDCDPDKLLASVTG